MTHTHTHTQNPTLNMYCVDAPSLPSSALQQQQEECTIRNMHTPSSNSSSSSRFGEMAEMLPPNREGIQRVVNVLQNSSLTCGTVAYPTESSYVLACNARSEDSVNARKFTVLWLRLLVQEVVLVLESNGWGSFYFTYGFMFFSMVFVFFSWLSSFD